MKKNTPPLWTALVLPALWAFDTAGEDLTSSPAEGLTLRKAYINEAQLSLDDSSTTVNGASQDFELEMTASTNQSYTFIDHYAKTSDGDVLRLERTFDDLNSTTERTMVAPVMGEVESSAQGESDLEGVTVVFEWSEDDGDYTVAFSEDEGGDEELLEGLTFDLDFAGVLPDDEVTAGAEWSIDPEVFRSCFAPGGALKLDMEVEGDDPGMGGPEPSPDLVLGDFSGEASGMLASIEDTGDGRVAIIRIQVDISTAKDLTDLMADVMEEQEGPPGAEMSMDAFDMEFEFEGEGEVRWSLETGTLVSLELSGEQISSTDTAMTMSMGGNEMEVENSMTLSGSNTIRLEVSVEG